MQPQIKPHPPIFDTADKLLRFGVSDVGEFVDSVYREQQSSKFFGKIIGRQSVTVHGKGVFTTADIVCEGYLHKKGSWMKNWKKRYFILRKDIRSLCYYASREDLTLLGAIPLDSETRLMNIKPEDADGYSNVVAIETDLDDGPNRTYVRFETFEKMKAWMLDIKNEAQNMVAATDEEIDWWENLFGAADLIEPKNNATRREGVTAADHEQDDIPKLHPPKQRPIVAPPTPSDKGEAPAIDSDDDTDEEGKGPAGGPSSKEPSVADKRRSTNGQLYLVNSTSKVHKKIKHMKPDKKPPGPPPFEHFQATSFESPQGALLGLQFSLRLCNICTYQDRLFIVIFGSNLNEKSNETLAQAVQTATGNGTSGAGNPASVSTVPTTTQNPATPASKRGSTAPTTGRWTQLGRTEVRMVTERPAYSESYVGDVKIFFHVMQNLIPEASKEIKIVVYRQENPDASRVGGTVDGKHHADDLNQQLEIARTVIPRKLFDFKSVLKFKMKVKMQLPVDIAVPLFKDAEVTLGVLKLSSFILNQHRYWLQKTLKATPYSEILYSFVTNTGVTESLEQLVASKYGTSVGQAMISLLSSERQDFLQDRIRSLKENFASVVRDLDNKARLASGDGAGTNSGDGNVDDKVTALYEPYRQAIECIEEVFQESNELASIILSNFDNVTQGKEVKNNVIPVDIGGGILRRSVWKKITIWQYCTTNLNVHMMLNKFFTHRDVYASVDSENTNYRGNVVYTPTITLGCPAAHELGFHDGGLRRIFNDIQSVERKLVWLQAIQSPDTELLQKLFGAAPKEALALFGAKCGTMASQEELAHTLKRKSELARRIDICASQALGCAVTVVRNACLLATIAGGNHFDTLARSLKIGFLVMFQSYLSTQGAEVGMLEDLEIAALWLSLVTVRLVTYPSGSGNPGAGGKPAPLDMNELAESVDRTVSTGSATTTSSTSSGTSTPPPPPPAGATSPSPSTKSFRRKYSEEGKQLFTGYGDGITIRRDLNGRLTVDIEITAQEASVILEALNFMSQFPLKPTLVLPPSNTVSFAFHPNPAVSYSRGENLPRIYAVAELFGVVFTQGVNEMQTLANLSSSRDVLKQVDINQSSLGKLREYYTHYREALEFQLTKRLPEMVDALTQSAIEQQQQMMQQASIDGGSPSISGPSTTSMAGRGPVRRKSHRPSLFPGTSFIGNITVNTGQMNIGVSQSDILNFTTKVEQLSVKVLNYNDRLLDQLHESIIVSATNPYDKHVDVLLRSSAIARQICGTVATLCKSGKDRTSMGVTLENSRSLVEDLGVHNGQEVCQLMRSQGVRRMNVYANTGQTMFAFNQIQRRALPACFRPPPGCHAGNVTS